MNGGKLSQLLDLDALLLYRLSAILRARIYLLSSTRYQNPVEVGWLTGFFSDSWHMSQIPITDFFWVQELLNCVNRDFCTFICF